MHGAAIPIRLAQCAQISMDFFLATGLGLGSTEHGEEPKDGQVGRKGISCERTFARISAPEDLEAKVVSRASKLSLCMINVSTFDIPTGSESLSRSN